MNISEFAKYAGVSKSAVSRYFNDGYLSTDKRVAIEKALEETGYTPSASAQSVRTKVTKMIGVILPKLSSESSSRVVEGISQVLDSQGYELLLVNTDNDPHKEVKYLELFRQNKVDGVIFLASVFTDLHLSVLKKMRIPVIIVGQTCQGFSCVCHNDYGAAYALTKLMLDKDRKNPACIRGISEDKACGQARFDGFTKALEEQGIALQEKNVVTAQLNMDSGYEKAKMLFSGEERPDCLFCATDTIALGVMLYCRENKIRIPEDVMICSVGDSEIGRMAYVPLTTAHLHYKTSGIEAAEKLLSAMRKRDSIPRTMQLDYEIIERESTEIPQECENI